MTDKVSTLSERLRATFRTEEERCDWPGCDDGYEGNRYCRKCHGEPVKPAADVLNNPDGPEAADRISQLEEREARLVEALRPFAARAEQPGFDDAPDDSIVRFFAKDVRTAVRALTPSKDTTDDE